MRDCKIESKRFGVLHGYNHDIEIYHFSVTLYNEVLTERMEIDVRQIAQTLFPIRSEQGLSNSYPESNIFMSKVKNEDKTWTHTWEVKYYVPGCD